MFIVIDLFATEVVLLYAETDPARREYIAQRAKVSI
jgi:hypothetical protein